MIKSKERISGFGEVFTSEKEVKAMLDLVLEETNRIDSKFFEPACGNGNFLIEILTRKMGVIKHLYAKSQIEFERYTFSAVSNIYGVDILEDNVLECRERLYDYTNNMFTTIFQNNSSNFLKIIKYVLSKNILHGDALTLNVPNTNKPIIFAEWSFTSGSNVKRSDYTLANLLAYQPFEGDTLFSDLGDKVLIPHPIKIHEVKRLYELDNE